MATIRQLAKIAGVSIATVSMALHNHPRISAATRRRIQELAALYQYQPPMSHALISERCGTIGCILPAINSSFYSRVLEGILSRAFTASYHVVILTTYSNIDRSVLAITALVEQHVDGLLISSGHFSPLPAEVLLDIASRNIPTVCIDITPTARPLDHVLPNEERLSHLAVEYLYHLGHRRLAFVANTEANPRRMYFTKAAQQFGLTAQFVLQDFSGNEDALTAVLQQSDVPTAIFCYSDNLGALVLRHAIRQGLKVPRDLSVLGCGNHLLGQYTEPMLTTIEQYPEDIGRRGLELLLQRITMVENHTVFIPETLMVEPELVIRHSCCPPR